MLSQSNDLKLDLFSSNSDGFQVKAHGVLNTNGSREIRWGESEKFSVLSTFKNDQIYIYIFFERTFHHRFTDRKRETNLDKYEVNYI